MYFDRNSNVMRILLGLVGAALVASLVSGQEEGFLKEFDETEVVPTRPPFVPNPFMPFIQEGIPGIDFPNFTRVPAGIRFSCRNREPGFYAEPAADCQVYHQCLGDGRSYSFLCGIGSIFNQRAFTCDHWYNYNCADAIHDYKYNIDLYAESLPEDNDVGLEDPNLSQNQPNEQQSVPL